MDDRSRMNREVHVRFWESVGVRFPCATQLPEGLLERSRGDLQPEPLFQVLQSGTRPRSIRLSDTRGRLLSAPAKGLRKLTATAVEIRTRRGFPQLLENSLGDSAFSQLPQARRRLGDGLNINPFQRQRSTLRTGIFCPKNGEPLRERASEPSRSLQKLARASCLSNWCLLVDSLFPRSAKSFVFNEP